MSRLNDAISNVAYIFDALMAYRNIVDSGDCNRCGKKKTCEYIPKVGQLVRYNCPFYEQNQEAKHSTESSLTQKELDTISRQAAEKRIEESLSRTFVDVSGLGKNILKDVPSTQPDIIRCKCCVHRPRKGGFDIDNEDYKCPYRCSDDYYTVVPRDDFFCAYGEMDGFTKWVKSVADSYRQPTNEQRRTKTWTTEEVAELLFNMFGDDCACNFNNIDEWLPESCAYRETTCPDPKEKHGCWVQFLLNGGGSTSEEGHDKRRSNTVD